MAPPPTEPPTRSLTALSDDALRARLWQAAETRVHGASPSTRDRAGQACLEIITELRRRRAPLTGATGSGAARSVTAST